MLKFVEIRVLFCVQVGARVDRGCINARVNEDKRKLELEFWAEPIVFRAGPNIFTLWCCFRVKREERIWDRELKWPRTRWLDGPETPATTSRPNPSPRSNPSQKQSFRYFKFRIFPRSPSSQIRQTSADFVDDEKGLGFKVKIRTVFGLEGHQELTSSLQNTFRLPFSLLASNSWFTFRLKRFFSRGSMTSRKNATSRVSCLFTTDSFCLNSLP